MRPFCVLDVTEFYGTTSGGVKTYLAEKANYVEARPELRHVLIVPGERSRVLERPGVRWYHLGAPRVPWQPPYRLLLQGRAIRRIVARERPDVVEIGSHFLAPWLAASAARAAGVPAVWFCHSDLPRIIASHPERNAWARHSAASLARGYLRLLGRLGSVTLAASESIAGTLETIGVENVVRVSLGVDAGAFHPGRRAHAARIRRRLGLPGGPLALYAGRIAGEKGLDVLLEAWIAVERATGAHLALVGEGPCRAGLRARCRARSIHWLPYEVDRGRLADLMASADLYVAPSAVETFGLAALEAMACGTPVLSADRGAVAEHVRRSGAGGLYASGSTTSLAAAAIRLLTGPLNPLREAGSEYVSRELGWASAFDRIFSVHRRVAGRA